MIGYYTLTLSHSLIHPFCTCSLTLPFTIYPPSPSFSSQVSRVDVSTTRQNHGYSWSITFLNDNSTTRQDPYPLLANGYNLHAAVDASVGVVPMVEYEVGGLSPGVPYFVSVAAVNAYGVSTSTASLPTSKQPVAQPPPPPQQVRAYMHINHDIDLQFNLPHTEHTLGSVKKTFKSYGKLHN